MYFCIKCSIGDKVKLASCKSALTPAHPTLPPALPLLPPPPTHTHPMVYSISCSKAVVPVLALLFVALRFILRGELFQKR